MADLPATHGFEAIIRHDLWRVEVLEFSRVCSCFLRQTDEQFRAVKITIMIRSDVSDEIGWVLQTNRPVSEFDFHVVLQLFELCHPPEKHRDDVRERALRDRRVSTTVVKILRFAQ